MKKQYIRPVTEELTTNSGANLLAGSLPHNSLGQNSTPDIDFDDAEVDTESEGLSAD